MDERTNMVNGFKFRVYDNGGASLDRISVVILNYRTSSGEDMILGMDLSGKYFSNFSTGREGEHLGKLMQWDELPQQTRDHITLRLTSNEDDSN